MLKAMVEKNIYNREVQRDNFSKINGNYNKKMVNH